MFWSKSQFSKIINLQFYGLEIAVDMHIKCKCFSNFWQQYCHWWLHCSAILLQKIASVNQPLLRFLCIQVIDFKKLWGSRNHCILSFQGKTTHDNSVTEITFEFSISHRKHFLNSKYSATVIEHMYKQNKNILMT